MPKAVPRRTRHLSRGRIGGDSVTFSFGPIVRWPPWKAGRRLGGGGSHLPDRLFGEVLREDDFDPQEPAVRVEVEEDAVVEGFGLRYPSPPDPHVNCFRGPIVFQRSQGDQASSDRPSSP